MPRKPKKKKVRISDQVNSLLNNKSAFVILRNLAVGLLVVFALVLLKSYVESTWLGHRAEVLAYEFLNTQLPIFDPETEMPVILDISKIPGGKNGEKTSRASLKEIVKALVDAKPRGIALDIDFSPNESGWIDDEDPEFFDFCVQQRKSVPIVLGVFRTSAQKPSTWLGSAEYEDLAGDIFINRDDTSRMRTWLQIGQNERLYSLSANLVRAAKAETREPPSFLAFAIDEQNRVEVIDHRPDFQAATILINHSKLKSLETLPAISTKSISELADKFRNRFVIVGDATLGEATDNFTIPALDNDSVPGIYLHANAIYSLSESPLFELKTAFKYAIDITLGVIVLFVVAVIRWRSKDEKIDWEKKQKRFIWMTIAVCFVVGLLAVRELNILWLDFLLVIFALLLHPVIEKSIGKALKIH